MNLFHLFVFCFCVFKEKKSNVTFICASKHVKIRFFLDTIQSNNRDSSTSHHHSAYGCLLFIAFFLISFLFFLFACVYFTHTWRIGEDRDRDVDSERISDTKFKSRSAASLKQNNTRRRKPFSIFFFFYSQKILFFFWRVSMAQYKV
jgi:hypothetical protein